MGLRWGFPPVPFLAAHLAGALGRSRLPAVLCAELGVQDASAAALTRDAMHKLPRDAHSLKAIGDQVVAMLRVRIKEIREIPLISAPMPSSIEDEIRRWPTRPRSAMRASGLAQHPSHVRRFTLGDLLDVRAVAVRTAISVASLLETAGAMGSDES